MAKYLVPNGEQSEFSSDKLYDETFKSLEKSIARENHPVLNRIRSREWEVERLAKDYPAREEDIPEENRELPDDRVFNAVVKSVKLGYYSPYNKSLESMLEKNVKKMVKTVNGHKNYVPQ